MTAELPSVEERERLRALHPLGRFGEADEVVEAAIWLLSDAASFPTERRRRLPGVAPRDANDACSAATPRRSGARALKQLDLVEGLAGTLRHAGERGIREARRDVGLLLDSLGQPA
jgi:hypothetical protein